MDPLTCRAASSIQHAAWVTGLDVPTGRASASRGGRRLLAQPPLHVVRCVRRTRLFAREAACLSVRSAARRTAVVCCTLHAVGCIRTLAVACGLLQAAFSNVVYIGIIYVALLHGLTYRMSYMPCCMLCRV